MTDETTVGACDFALAGDSGVNASAVYESGQLTNAAQESSQELQSQTCVRVCARKTSVSTVDWRNHRIMNCARTFQCPESDVDHRAFDAVVAKSRSFSN